MANATPSRVGQVLGTGDTRSLFLKVFSGEVLTTFNSKTIMKDKTRTRNISSGKSAQFPAIGKTSASYHTPGAEIVGKVIQQDEKTITIDDLLISDSFIARIDEAMSHFDVRSEYSVQMGQALAQTYDRNLLSLAVKAARDPSGLGNGAVGQGDAVSVGIGVSPTVANIVDAAYAAAQAFDEKNIPENDRYLIVSPATYYKLVNSDKLLNLFYNPGNNGSYSDGKVGNVAGRRYRHVPRLLLEVCGGCVCDRWSVHAPAGYGYRQAPRSVERDGIRHPSSGYAHGVQDGCRPRHPAS